jgi:hypothetical protein
VCGKVIGKSSDGVCILALCGEQHAGLVDIDKQRDVVVAAPRGGLVDGDVGHVCGVHARPRLIDVGVNDAPQPGVVLADDAGHGGNRHGRNHGHEQRLEQQGEAAVRA